jgi:hypothetical protein
VGGTAVQGSRFKVQGSKFNLINLKLGTWNPEPSSSYHDMKKQSGNLMDINQ